MQLDRIIKIHMGLNSQGNMTRMVQDNHRYRPFTWLKTEIDHSCRSKE